MRIAVLMHASGRDTDLDRFHVFQLARIWRREGHEVLPVFGTRRFVPADVALLHVDLSRVPAPYLEFAARYPLCMNRHAADIRKSVISRHAVVAGDGWQGPVIVKSNLNCTGAPERLAAGAFARLAGGVRRRLARLAPGGLAPTPSDYRIFASRDEVPPALAAHPHAFVERFMPETRDGGYITRSQVFVGPVHTCELRWSPDPIVRIRNARVVEECEPEPAIARMCQEMRFDYGKFDFMMHDGRPTLIDANKTTGRYDYERFPAIGGMAERRARGLYAWVAEQGG